MTRPFLKILFSLTGLSGLPAANPLRKPKPSSLLSPSSAAPFFPPPPRSGTIMVGSCVTFYPNCFAIDGRYYRGKDYPAFCEAHVEKDWPYEKPNASKQTMDCPAPFSRGAFLPFLCSLLLQCQPCALLLHRLHPCRACLLLDRDDFSFLTRKSRKAYPNLWICGLIACSLGFILCALILAILIFFLAATVTGGL